jgi:hypothetical protein
MKLGNRNTVYQQLFYNFGCFRCGTVKPVVYLGDGKFLLALNRLDVLGEIIYLASNRIGEIVQGLLWHVLTRLKLIFFMRLFWGC